MKNKCAVLAHEILSAQMCSTMTNTHTHPEIYIKHGKRDETRHINVNALPNGN